MYLFVYILIYLLTYLILLKTDVVCAEQMTKPFKRTWCPCRRSKFEFQHPHDCSKSPVTLFKGM